MDTRILVPLDGTDASLAIVPQVCRAFCETDPELILVQAARPPPALYARGNSEPPQVAATAEILRVEERLADLGLRARSVVRIGSPARVILDAARRERVSLIAMRTHGRRGLTRFVVGSVTEEVLRLSPVPLLIVGPSGSSSKAGWITQEDQPLRTLLVPVDAGEASLSILPHAAPIAQRTGASVVLLQVFETEPRARPRPGSGGTPDRIAFDRLRRVSEGLQAQGISTHVLVEHGDPARVILECARLLGADLIAMATRGRSGVRRWLRGSVTENVLRRASVPLLVGPATSVVPEPDARSRETVTYDQELPLEALGCGP